VVISGAAGTTTDSDQSGGADGDAEDAAFRYLLMPRRLLS
jgi:hypothetical protein